MQRPGADALEAVGKTELEEQYETIKISCTEPYFVEDGIYAAASELASAKPFHLLVSTLPARQESLPLWSDGLGETQPKSWVLDVCLDFFACGNPFLSQVRPHIAAPFADVHNAALFRTSSVVDVEHFKAQQAAFDGACGELMRCAVGLQQSEAEDAEDAEEDDEDGEVAAGEEPDPLEAALQAVGQLLPCDKKEALISNLREALLEARGSELQQLREAGDMVTLPLHPSSEGEIQARLAAFEAFVRDLCAAFAKEQSPQQSGKIAAGKPAIVTVARSVVDGFCPMRWLCMLERGVLDILGKLFGDTEVIYFDELDAMESA